MPCKAPRSNRSSRKPAPRRRSRRILRGLCALALGVAISVPVTAQRRDVAAPSAPSLSSSDFAGLQVRNIGPALMSGRIADIAIHPDDANTWYVAVGSGGVWKTDNAGTTWTPIFDDQPSYSIGVVAIDPKRPNIVWVGTGENVSGRHVGYGDGVYKSTDGGATWANVGLPDSEHIGRILIDPRQPDTVYVASEGPLWSSGGERGVYKTTDGGTNWDHVLDTGAETGVTDLEFAPDDPDTLYAASFQRRRTVQSYLAGGPESGIHKSTDGGATWRRIAGGLPSGEVGKIGLAVTPANPDLVYATIEAENGAGFYRSTNRGESFEHRNDYTSGGTGPHYYQEIEASPFDADVVYQMDVWLHWTDDGGATFNELGEQDKHSDNHALAFDPRDPTHLIVGSDGGLYETFDHGETWKYVPNLPVSQFYKVAVGNEEPFYMVLGGLQDNGTQHGPSRTLLEHGIRNQDWTVPYGADGYASEIDPDNPNILYVTWQNGHPLRVDVATGEAVDIQPMPAPGDDPDRWNWDAPMLLSPHDSKRLYFGSHRMFRSDDRGDTWRPISGDLTRGTNRYEMPVAGRVRSVDSLWDHGAMSRYASLTAFDESPLEPGLFFTGSDDGLVHVSEDGGANWRRMDIPGAPERAFIEEVKASRHDRNEVFVVMENHKEGDYRPMLFRSRDLGRTWTSIVGDLPDRHILWSVEQDHVDRDLLFLGTEFGLFFTVDGGIHWIELTGGVPTIAFRDIEIQRRDGDLVASSFGRGIFVFDDYALLRDLEPATLAQEATLFPVRKAWSYVPAKPLATRGRAYQGGSFYLAPNPEFGAVATVHLGEAFTTAKQARSVQESERAEAGEDVSFPGWETLRQESREQDPVVFLTVRDAEGRAVRHVEVPNAPGFHRVAWDLRLPTPDPVRVGPPPPLPPWADPPGGPLAVAGTYSMELGLWHGGEYRALSGPQSFEVANVLNETLPGIDADDALRFQRQTSAVIRRATGVAAELSRAEERLEHVRVGLLQTPGASAELVAQAETLLTEVADLRDRLYGDRIAARWDEHALPSPMARLNQIVDGHWRTRYGPTETHRESFEIAASEVRRLTEDLRSLLDRVETLETGAQAAGVPWTPGRRLP